METGASAFLEIHAGAGGAEANDWASMLLRMYSHWAERKGYQINLLDAVDGDLAGIKTAMVQVEGENAYGLLQGEHCVHRLVRFSPFDDENRRMTSFVSVEVILDMGNDETSEISERDLRIDYYKVSHDRSAVRVTHLPTNIIASCQRELFPYQNRDVAMRVLKSKIIARPRHNTLGFGHQTRNYVFQPYTLVKDTRTNHETDEIARVMDGDIDDFIDAYLRWQRTQQI